MITAKEALELTQQPEPEVSDEEFQQYLDKVELHIKDLASRGHTHMRFWCNCAKHTVEEARVEFRKAEVVAQMLEKALKKKGYDVGIPAVEPWMIIVDWSAGRRAAPPDKPADLAGCQKILDEYVQRGEEILRMCSDAGFSVKFATSNHCQMKYYLTTKDNSFDPIFNKPDKGGGFIQTSGIPDARKAYADMLMVRLGQEGVELFLNLEKDIAESINAGCSGKYYLKNDCRTHRMYNLISDHYNVVAAWMNAMGYSFHGIQCDDPSYRISWDIEEDR